MRSAATPWNFGLTGASPFFTHSYWDLETTMTTFKNNMILWAHLEHPELW